LNIHNILSDKSTKLFLLLSGFFITNALVAEFIGIKIFSFEAIFGYESLNISLLGADGLGFNLTAGVVLWPVVFIMTDVINEYYGSKGVRYLSYLTVGLIVFAFAMIYLAIELPPNEWWQYQSGTLSLSTDSHVSDMQLAFSKVMGQGLWIIIGSLVAFLVGQVLDVYIYHKIKKATGESKVWLRATGSTLVSQFVDSYVVLVIAFYIGSDWSLSMVLAIGTINYAYKFVVAFLLTPVIYLLHSVIDQYLGENLAQEMKVAALA
jgi:queuosine precursor transporter